MDKEEIKRQKWKYPTSIRKANIWISWTFSCCWSKKCQWVMYNKKGIGITWTNMIMCLKLKLCTYKTKIYHHFKFTVTAGRRCLAHTDLFTAIITLWENVIFFIQNTTQITLQTLCNFSAAYLRSCSCNWWQLQNL